MALLPTTGLENHPVGSTGLNGIVNANWERLEAMLLPIATGNRHAQIGWDSAAKTFTLRAGFAVLAYSATPAVNFNGATLQECTLTGNATFSSSNLAAGARVTLILRCDGTGRTIGFPGAWRWTGTAPTTIAANKVGRLVLEVTGTTDSSVVATWTVEP